MAVLVTNLLVATCNSKPIVHMQAQAAHSPFYNERADLVNILHPSEKTSKLKAAGTAATPSLLSPSSSLFSASSLSVLLSSSDPCTSMICTGWSAGSSSPLQPHSIDVDGWSEVRVLARRDHGADPGEGQLRRGADPPAAEGTHARTEHDVFVPIVAKHQWPPLSQSNLAVSSSSSNHSSDDLTLSVRRTLRTKVHRTTLRSSTSSLAFSTMLMCWP